MGTSDNRSFASFLEDVLPRHAEGLDDDVEVQDTGSAAPTIPYDYLAVAEELHSGRIRVQPDRRVGPRDAPSYIVQLEAYLDAAAGIIEPALRDADVLAPVDVPSVDPSDIAAELALDKAARNEFPRIRRRFALANHPDRVAPHLREHAMRRMQIANSLIDAARDRAAD